MKEEIAFGTANQKKLSVNRKEPSQWSCQVSFISIMTCPKDSEKMSCVIYSALEKTTCHLKIVKLYHLSLVLVPIQSNTGNV